MTSANKILMGSGAVDAYEIEQSLVFDTPSHTGLVMSSANNGNRRKYTWSGWVKPSLFGGFQALFSTDSSANSHHTQLAFYLDNIYFNEYLYVPNGTRGTFTTNRLFRDPSAWYHIVLAYDSAQSTGSDRIKLYVNGVRETSFSNYADTPHNYESITNVTSNPIKIGNGYGYASGAQNIYGLNGYLAEVNFLDGTAAAASSLGETNSATGQWIPKEYEGSYGTNGFYLKFASGAIGTDSSGQGNNFTASNLANSDVVTDSPTNNFATMNPIFVGDDSNTFKDGNLKVVTATLNGGLCVATFAPLAGKYYAEFKVVILGASSNSLFGVRDLSDDPMNVVSGWHNRNLTTQSTKNMGYYGYSGEIFSGPSGAVLTTAATYTTNDVIGVAIDYDNSTVKWYKNNALQYTKTSADLKNVTFALSDSSGSSGFTTECNFGQKPFAYTPPSGYVTLSTANLPDPAIPLPSAHFNSVVWTGNATDNRAIAVGFAPNFTWFKQRTGTNSYGLFDNVRGNSSPNGLSTNTTSREFDWTGIFKGHTSTGFTVGTDTAVNANSNNYVGWNWKAGGATPVKTYVVKVVSDSGNKYRFDDFAASAQTVDMQEGGTYTFDQSDSSNSNHPFRFSTTSNGSHASGSEYTTGVVTSGTPGSSGAKTVITIAASSPTLYYYCTNHSGMGGQANTNSTYGSSYFDGDLKSTVSANQAAGFSIVTWLSDNSNAGGVPHGLGVAPELVIYKTRNTDGSHWNVLTTVIDGSTDYLILNTLAAKGDVSSTYGGVASSTITNFGFTGNPQMLAYCFVSKPGYSKMGVYLGNGRVDGTMVNLGFTPAWVMIKDALGTGNNWIIFDTTRDPDNEIGKYLVPNSNAAEADFDRIDFLSNGFKIRHNYGADNTDGRTYLYMAFAKSAFKYANAR